MRPSEARPDPDAVPGDRETPPVGDREKTPLGVLHRTVDPDQTLRGGEERRDLRVRHLVPVHEKCGNLEPLRIPLAQDVPRIGPLDERAGGHEHHHGAVPLPPELVGTGVVPAEPGELTGRRRAREDENDDRNQGVAHETLPQSGAGELTRPSHRCVRESPAGEEGRRSAVE
jgi:hypothetical protein